MVKLWASPTISFTIFEISKKKIVGSWRKELKIIIRVPRQRKVKSANFAVCILYTNLWQIWKLCRHVWEALHVHDVPMQEIHLVLRHYVLKSGLYIASTSINTKYDYCFCHKKCVFAAIHGSSFWSKTTIENINSMSKMSQNISNMWAVDAQCTGTDYR